MKMYLISCWMLRSNCRVFKKKNSVMFPCIPANLEPSFATVKIFCLQSERVINLSSIMNKPGGDFLCSESILLKNLYTLMSIAWDISSSCSITPLLFKTFLTSRIFYVLSSISKASSSSLVLEFKNMMISFSSVGLSPNSPLILSMACLLLCTSSCYSNIICMNRKIFVIDWQMSIQILSFSSESVLAMTVSFCSFCNSFLSLCVVCIYVL